MSFADVFWHQLQHGRIPWVFGLWAMVTALARFNPEARGRLRMPTYLLVMYLLTALVVTAVITHDGDPRIPATVSLAFELLSLIGIVQVLVFSLVLPRLGARLPRIVVDVVTVVAVVIAMIVVGKRAGFSVAGLITTSAVLTAVLGFALQDTLGNLMGGLALQLDSSIQVGDWISLGVGQTSGQVVDIRWRYTALETRAWETLIVPNSVLMKSQVVVLGRRQGEPRRIRRQVDFQVDYRTPPTDVIAAVTRTLVGDPPPRVVLEPTPIVLLLGVSDSVARYAVRYWSDDLAIDDPTDSDVRVRIYFALRRAGVGLAIPAQAVFVSHDDEARRARKARDAHHERLAALGAVDLLAALSAEERDRLASRLTLAPFATGEAITREGDVDDGLYIIVDGNAEVCIGQGADRRAVANLGPGQFFGEMALLTGEARAATVIAVSDLQCYRLDKHGFEELLRGRPAVAEAVAELLADRRSALESAREESDDAPASRASAKQDLLGRIRKFFALG